MHNLGNNDTQAHLWRAELHFGLSVIARYISKAARRIRVPPLVNPADVSSFRGGFIKFCKNNSDASLRARVSPKGIRQTAVAKQCGKCHERIAAEFSYEDCCALISRL